MEESIKINVKKHALDTFEFVSEYQFRTNFRIERHIGIISIKALMEKQYLSENVFRF